jgi:hypothetical protein
MLTRTTRFTLLVVFLTSILLGVEYLPKVTAAGIPDPRFGVVQAHEAPAAATALGAGWSRVTFEWNRIQPNGPDEWNSVPISDHEVNNELAQGRQLVGLLVTTPGWATDVDSGPGVPKGLYLPPDDPGNAWAGFVRTIVGRYTGRIDHWTVWNEPDIPTGSQDMTWGGSIEDFVRLLQVAHKVAKETNPGAVIHMAAITHHHDEHWFGRFIDTLVAQPGAAEHGYYFDIATLHLYHEPEKIYDITAHYSAMMRGRGIHKPIWIAETNAYLSRATPEEQAFFMFQALSLEIAAGAQRMAVYKMVDTETDSSADPEPFGLVQMDGSRRPAFTAYQVAATYLAGFRSGSWNRRDDISVVTVDRGAQTTTVLWARTPEPQTAMIAARTTRALLVDVRGGAHHVYPERGYYFVNLSGADCTQGCWIGGAPYMLVEQAPTSAGTAPEPQPPTRVEVTGTQQSVSPNATTTPAATASSTSTATPTVVASPTSHRVPSPTPTESPAPSPTSTSTPAATPTAMPPPTATPTWTSTCTPSPSPSPVPVPSPSIPSSRPWVLAIVLVIGLGGVAIAAERSRPGP